MEEPVNPIFNIPPVTPVPEVNPEVVENAQPEPLVEQPLLHSCGHPIVITDRFCPSCGKEIAGEVVHNNIFATKSLILALAYYGFCFIVWLLIKYGNVIDTIQDFYTVLFWDAIVTIGFAIVGIRNLLPLYSVKNVQLKKVLLYIPLAIVASIAINFICTKMNTSLFNEDSRFYPGFEGDAYPFISMVLCIALYPALFEEMAFRGFLFNNIQKIAGSTNAIYISSIIFAFVHFSLLSLFWIIPFAIVAARLRQKHNTLWYGMVIHFFFNLTACVIDMYDWF